ncbi:MAG: hypothetical protein R3E48_09675 [Burkholderiaceae bacterium]
MGKKTVAMPVESVRVGARGRGRLAWAGLVLAGGLAAVAPPWAAAQTAVDRAVAAVAYDLDRIARELPALTPSKTANIKRVERVLRLAEQRLMAAPAPSDPGWAAQKGRLDEYRARLASLSAPAPAPTSPAATSPAPVAAPATTGARVPGPASSAEAARARPAAAAPAASQMPSYEVVKFTKLARDLDSATQSLARLDPKSLHDARELANWRGRVNFLRNGLARFAPFAADPRVGELGTRVERLANDYAAIEKPSLAAYRSLGDIPARVGEIERHYRAVKPPEPLAPPYTAERAQAWAGYMSTLAREAGGHAAWLRQVLATTGQHQREVKNALNGTIGSRVNGAIRRAVEDTRRALYAPLSRVGKGSEVEFVSNLKPGDTRQVRNALLAEGQYEKFVGELRAAREAVENGRVIDRALGQPESTQAAQAIAAIDQRRQRIDSLFETVLADVRMPKARSTDPKLVAAAEQALARLDPRPKWLRLVVNTAPTQRSESRAWWRGGTVTIADYTWTEFQVATAEEVNGQHFVFYNSIHYYTSGSAQTPLNKWIVNRRFQSSRILKQNVARSP